MSDKNEIDKLKILLPHWIDHNRNHGKEFKKWADIARDKGHAGAADKIELAISKITEADDALSQALKEIGGTMKSHSHDHNHDHKHDRDH